MIKTLLLLAVAVLVWWAVLWLGLPMSWNSISPSAILLAHLGPPLLLVGGVKAALAWRAQKAERAAALAAQQQEAQQQAQRQQALEAHQSRLAQRRQGLACRWLWSGALPARDEPDWLDEAPGGCHWQALERDELAGDDVLDIVQPQLEALLSTLYADAPGASCLPHYLEAIPAQEGAPQLRLLQTLQRQAAAEQGLPMPSGACLFLPGGAPLGERVHHLLEQQPEQPGVVVLAFDASALPPGDDDDDAPPRSADLPAPGAAVVGMLFLRDTLPPPQPDEAAPDDEDTLYQPYWERETPVDQGGWGRVPPQWQAQLAALPVLASLHQGAGASDIPERQQPLEACMAPLLEGALVNAALHPQPFDADTPDEAATPQPPAWLVHNSGPITQGKARLTAVANTLGAHQIDLNPVDEASNTVRDWGNAGAADELLQHAVAISHCARLAAPVVIARFAGNGVHLAVARPAAEPNSEETPA